MGVQDADSKNKKQQEYCHYNHEHVCLTWSVDERRQMIGSRGVDGFSHATPVASAASYSRANRKRSELPMTDTELRLMAAAATIGLNNRPKAG